MIKIKVSKSLIENINICLIVLYIFSYGIGGLLEIDSFTLIVFSLIVITNIFYNFLFKPKIYFNITDLVIFILISYSIFHFYFNSNINNIIITVINSFAAYYIGRIILLDEKKYKLMHKTINILSLIIIVFLIYNYFTSSTMYRVSIKGTHPIAIGELLGIFCLVNLFSIKGFNKNIINIFFVILGIYSCFFIISSRGTIFALLLSAFIVTFMKSKNKKKIILIALLIIIVYLILFSNSSILVNKYPGLRRFSIDGIMNDASLLGNESYMGRKNLYLMSIELFKISPITGVGMLEIYSHNIFLEFLSTLGLVGLVIFIFFSLNIFYKIINYKYTYNYFLVSLFLYCFIYRQSSFAMNAHKALFISAGMIVTYSTIKSNKFKIKRD